MKILERQLQDEHAAKRALMGGRLAETHTLTRNRKAVNGAGAPVAEIPLESYLYWQRREGSGVWKDKRFMHEYLRDNPACRVKAQGTRLQVGYGTCQTFEPRVKFHKSYPSA